MARAMRRFLAILIGFSVLFAVGAGSIVEAAEPIDCASETLAVDHTDSSPAPLDDQGPDKATQHAHGCHGHHLATANDGAAFPVAMPRLELHSAHDRAAIPVAAAGPALRPPIV